MPSDGLFPPVKRDRRARIRKLGLAINSRKKNDNVKEIIAMFMLDEVVSKRKVREYLEILKLTGKIDNDISF